MVVKVRTGLYTCMNVGKVMEEDILLRSKYIRINIILCYNTYSPANTKHKTKSEGKKEKKKESYFSVTQ